VRNSVKRTAVPEPLRAVTSLESWTFDRWRRWRSLAFRGEGRARLDQPLDGATPPSPVGSPAARKGRIFSVALAFGEKAHRLTIVPPSPVAMARNGCDFSVLLKYSDLCVGVPTPPHSIHEVQKAG
jgi:hypothetical protein